MVAVDVLDRKRRVGGERQQPTADHHVQRTRRPVRELVSGNRAGHRVEQRDGEHAAGPLRPVRGRCTGEGQVDRQVFPRQCADVHDVAAAEHPEQRAVEHDQQRKDRIHRQVEEPAVGLDRGSEIPGQQPVAEDKDRIQSEHRRPEPPAPVDDGEQGENEAQGHEPTLE